MATKYTLKVYPQGMCREVFRTLQVFGEITLDDLHYAILDAFDFDYEHLYEFSTSGRLYDDDNYVFDPEGEYEDEDEDVKSTDARLDELALEKGSKFLFHYDFGDDWVFCITVMKTEEVAPEDIPEDMEPCDALIVNSKGEIQQYPDPGES